VVGTGQSGCQIAEDLHLAGRQVHLCVGGAPRTARFHRGRDVVDWLADMGYYDMPVDQHPLKERVRAKANHYVTGRDGGRDIDLRRFALEGMRLYGRLEDIRGDHLTFRDDLAHNLDQADAVSESIKASIDKFIAARGIDAPPGSAYSPPWVPPADHPRSLDLSAAGIGTVIWCVGYRSDFRWIEVPVFDGSGYPSHRRGVSAVDGLYFGSPVSRAMRRTCATRSRLGSGIGRRGSRLRSTLGRWGRKYKTLNAEDAEEDKVKGLGVVGFLHVPRVLRVVSCYLRALPQNIGFFAAARYASTPAMISAFASSGPTHPVTFTHLPGSRSL
jgi:hypothetical protein